jgi:hypothetical protein
MTTKHFLLTIHVFIFSVFLLQAQIFHREDTLFIPEANVLPLIDGTIDAAWDIAEWRSIDQIWMPYNNLPGNIKDGLKLWGGPDDFTGKFKIMWSSETNLLYFLAEIVDDVFVDGYSFPNNGYPNYDILEVFIDEDRSGGPHVFDNKLWPGGSNCPSCNAENAFAYHLAADAKADGEVQTSLQALDIAGNDWGTIRDYASHLPEFALVKNGSKYIWEFSLIVHNDTYNHSNQSASVVTLNEGKILGLSMAYCDNDDPNESPLKRDHFFGSVEVPFSAHNDHWINANWFGVAKLTGEGTTNVGSLSSPQIITRAFFANQKLNASVNSSTGGLVQVRVVNILGAEVMRYEGQKTAGAWQVNLPVSNLHKGIYLVEILYNNARFIEKVMMQ